MVGHGGSSAGSYLADPTSPIPSHCASIVATSIVSVNDEDNDDSDVTMRIYEEKNILKDQNVVTSNPTWTKLSGVT